MREYQQKPVKARKIKFSEIAECILLIKGLIDCDIRIYGPPESRVGLMSEPLFSDSLVNDPLHYRNTSFKDGDYLVVDSLGKVEIISADEFSQGYDRYMGSGIL